VSDVTHANGSAGAPSPAEWQAQPSIVDQLRQLQQDATALAADVRGTTAELEHYLNEQVTRRPYRSLGVAAGIGYVLGGAFTPRLTLLLLGGASRVVTALALRQLGARLFQNESTVGQRHTPEISPGATKERV
jgi:ElaB/YqjD/DUF883 family membrane-anchored ribosome-binding protein